MTLVRREIVVPAPADELAGILGQPERLPDYVDAVQEVRPSSSGRSKWRVQVGGRDVEFETVAVPARNARLRTTLWRSVHGPRHCGKVVLDEQADGTTRMTVLVSALPESKGGRAALALGLLDLWVDKALRQFRDRVRTDTGRREHSATAERVPAPTVSPESAMAGKRAAKSAGYETRTFEPASEAEGPGSATAEPAAPAAPAANPAQAPLGTPGTPYGPVPPYTDPGQWRGGGQHP